VVMLLTCIQEVAGLNHSGEIHIFTEDLFGSSQVFQKSDKRVHNLDHVQ